ncbi:hypothetical protein SRB5_34730 [Streptomyces sp. RB5]|uniref:Lipoprotein n=1 Tax=Streptomyces smaragdinus TaxID=2585196 RepID=A0A7K0CIL4_9ACTN|nr:hypothetical protein [Streptomyces smaragdinus]MQY13329.1 hypothetical protein [Streptomyces smaragdinus]
MRISRPMVLAACAAALTLPLTACGGDSEQNPADALAAAVAAVSQKSSAEVEVVTEDPEDGKTLGEGRTSWKAGSEGTDLVMRKPGDPEWVKTAGADGETRLMVGKDALYMEMDASQLNGKKWLKLGGEESAPDEPGSLPTYGPEVLIAALSTAGDLKKAGSEQIAGQDTDHYTGTVDVAKLAKAKLEGISAKDRDDWVAEQKDGGIKKVTLDVWIGDDDLAVRTVKSARTAKGAMKETTDITGYGDGFALEVPPAAETATLEELMRAGQ